MERRGQNPEKNAKVLNGPPLGVKVILDPIAGIALEVSKDGSKNLR